MAPLAGDMYRSGGKKNDSRWRKMSSFSERRAKTAKNSLGGTKKKLHR